MYDHLNQALEILAEPADEGAGNYIWEMAFYEVSLNQNKDAESYLAKHERLWALDRDNPFLLRSAGNFLLPRWYGSHEELDAFARHAITFTHETLGLGAYAFVYSEHGNISYNDVSGSGVDLDLLRRATYDLVEHFPGNGMLNRAVRIANWADLHDVVLDIFARPLQEIHPPYWGLEMHDTEDVIEYAFLASNYARLNF